MKTLGSFTTCCLLSACPHSCLLLSSTEPSHSSTNKNAWCWGASTFFELKYKQHNKLFKKKHTKGFRDVNKYSISDRMF